MLNRVLDVYEVLVVFTTFEKKLSISLVYLFLLFPRPRRQNLSLTLCCGEPCIHCSKTQPTSLVSTERITVSPALTAEAWCRGYRTGSVLYIGAHHEV